VKAGELLAAKRDLDLPRRLRKLDSFDFLLLNSLDYTSLHSPRTSLAWYRPGHYRVVIAAPRLGNLAAGVQVLVDMSGCYLR